MSVTIYPTTKAGETSNVVVDCRFCEGSGRSNWDGACSFCTEYPPFTPGKEVVTIHPYPELNLANANFAVLAEALGLPNEPAGELPAEAVGLLDAQISSLLASSLAESADFQNSASYGGASRGARVITLPASDESWKYRLEELRRVVGWAAQNGRGICWN